MIDFTAERARHARFVGRAALLAQLDGQLLAGPSQWVVVTGGPGMGKSAVLAAWLARRDAAGGPVPHHFIRRGRSNWDDPEALVSSLIAQIEARYSDVREVAADAERLPAERLDAVLRRVSERVLVPRGERLVVLIDGLDEYEPRSGGSPADPLAAFLPYALPDGVSVLCASRPRHPYVSSLATRGILVSIDLDSPAFADDNAAIVRALWKLAGDKLGLDARFVAEAADRAAGNVQHAVMWHQHLAGLPPGERSAEQIARGLARSIAIMWARVATDPSVVEGLGILCAALEPLTLDELGRVARWTDAASRESFMRGARELLIATGRADGTREYRLHHDSIREHIAHTIGSDALAAHHRALAERLATWPAPDAAGARRYALHHALSHRAEAGMWPDVWRIATDTGFLAAKCRELGVDATEADLWRIATRCLVRGDESQGERLVDLAQAVGREAYWLREAPEAIAALLWNRLRRYGWTASELDAELRAPADFLRVSQARRERAAAVPALKGHGERVNACAVTPDGRHVVSASDDRTLRVWALASRREVARLEGHTASVLACAVTPDGCHVVSASRDRTLLVWELATRKAVVRLEGHTASVLACTVTPDGRYVVSASDDRTLRIWDLTGEHPVLTLVGHAGFVEACAVTPDGRYVISASADRTLKLWERASGQALATLNGHREGVHACAVSPDGRHLVSASGDHTLKVWSLPGGREVATLEGHTGSVLGCAVTPDGQHVVSASGDMKLRIWELESGRPVAILPGHIGWASACAVTPDGRHVVSASWDTTLRVWELARRLDELLEGHTDRVLACAVTPDGRHAVSASADQLLKVWDLTSGRAVGRLEGHTGGVVACAVTPDSRHVVSASGDRTLKVWDLASRHVLATFEGHGEVVRACAVSPDGRRVVSASRDTALKVWRLKRGRVTATVNDHVRSVVACAVTPDGRHVVISGDTAPKVWDLASRRELVSLRDHTGSVVSGAVTPDGRRVILASGATSLKVWDLTNGEALTTLDGHASLVTACCVTPDGRHVISASYDQTLKVWDLATSTCLVTHHGDAAYVAVAASATKVVAGDVAGTVWFLDLPAAVRSPVPQPGRGWRWPWSFARAWFRTRDRLQPAT
ncbi:MAG TPA: AAA family ATPase [Kofleriaceae bacterium]|nr:AAA family ATPase [Kofleriaceae bacterium]